MDEFEGKVAVASPTGGTARCHFLALQQALGSEATQRYLEGLSANRAVIARGDRQLADLIGEGEAAAGMTDTSDYLWVASQGKPVAMVFPDQDGCGTLLIPHTVALLRTAGFGCESTTHEANSFLRGDTQNIQCSFVGVDETGVQILVDISDRGLIK